MKKRLNKIYSTVRYTELQCFGFLCDCKTSSLTLREECRLRVSENKVLRRILGPKRDKVTGETVSRMCTVSKLILVSTVLTCSSRGLRGQARTAFREVTSCY